MNAEQGSKPQKLGCRACTQPLPCTVCGCVSEWSSCMRNSAIWVLVLLLPLWRISKFLGSPGENELLSQTLSEMVGPCEGSGLIWQEEKGMVRSKCLSLDAVMGNDGPEARSRRKWTRNEMKIWERHSQEVVSGLLFCLVVENAWLDDRANAFCSCFC